MTCPGSIPEYPEENHYLANTIPAVTVLFKIGLPQADQLRGNCYKKISGAVTDDITESLGRDEKIAGFEPTTSL